LPWNKVEIVEYLQNSDFQNSDSIDKSHQNVNIHLTAYITCI